MMAEKLKYLIKIFILICKATCILQDKYIRIFADFTGIITYTKMMLIFAPGISSTNFYY